MLKLKNLFYELLAIPLLVPLLHNNVFAFEENVTQLYNQNIYYYTFNADETINIQNTGTTIYDNLNFEYNGKNLFTLSRGDIGQSFFWNNGKPATISTRKNSNGFYTNYFFNSKLICKTNSTTPLDIVNDCTYNTLNNGNWGMYNTERTNNIISNVKKYVYISNSQVSMYFNGGSLCGIGDNGTVCFVLNEGQNTNNTGLDLTENWTIGYYYNGGYKTQKEIYGNGFEEIIPFYYDTDFITEYIGLDNESPLNSGPGTEGSPISCVNIQTQIMLYGNKYNTGMCYTNGLTYSGLQLVQTGKQSIFELYPSYNNFREALTIYSTYCNPNSPTTPEYCQQQMSQYSEYTYQFYNYLEQANNENTVFSVESEKLYQYCHLQLNYTEEEKRNNCKETVDDYYATGVNQETANGNPFEGITERVENNIQIAVPQTGTVFDEFLEGDMWNISITDRYDNFMEIFHKITGLFKYRATQEGIIPSYITGLIMLILLLALFKK